MTPGQDTIDKILDHNRLQLSALVDGELSADEARFLLRRLQHDGELAGCWERWQVCGDVLRGRADALLPSGFAARVANVIALEPGVPTRITASGPRWLRWGGGAALAASVAVITLLLVRQSPDAKAPAAQAPSQIAAVTPAATTSRPQPAATAPSSPSIPATQFASAIAVADVPRRIAARRTRGQSQRAALRIPARTVAEVPVAVAANAVNATAPIDPFSAQRVGLPNRPWPKALLPGSPANGAFTVDYGSRGTTSPSFYPFEPRPAPVAHATDHGDAPP